MPEIHRAAEVQRAYQVIGREWRTFGTTSLISSSLVSRSSSLFFDHSFRTPVCFKHVSEGVNDRLQKIVLKSRIFLVQPQKLSSLLMWKQTGSVPHRSCSLTCHRLQWNKESLSSVQFSRSVVSDSLQPRGLQHASPPCPSPTPGAYSNSGP